MTTAILEAPLEHAQDRPAGNNIGGGLTPEQTAFYRDEGYLVLPHLLTDEELAPARQAMTDKVEEIAQALFAGGIVADRHERAPFERRLALLFDGLSDEEFLKFGRSWRERRPGYFHLMANPKILERGGSR